MKRRRNEMSKKGRLDSTKIKCKLKELAFDKGYIT
jgi:hypothetical protein